MEIMEFIKDNCNGGTTPVTDCAFVSNFYSACDRLGLNKDDPKLISLAYSLYLDGIIHVGISCGSQLTEELLDSLPVGNLPKA